MKGKNRRLKNTFFYELWTDFCHSYRASQDAAVEKSEFPTRVQQNLHSACLSSDTDDDS
jgi:hypothetical protein